MSPVDMCWYLAANGLTHWWKTKYSMDMCWCVLNNYRKRPVEEYNRSPREQGNELNVGLCYFGSISQKRDAMHDILRGQAHKYVVSEDTSTRNLITSVHLQWYTVNSTIQDPSGIPSTIKLWWAILHLNHQEHSSTLAHPFQNYNGFMDFYEKCEDFST